jgi:hypothetical protein
MGKIDVANLQYVQTPETYTEIILGGREHKLQKPGLYEGCNKSLFS